MLITSKQYGIIRVKLAEVFAFGLPSESRKKKQIYSTYILGFLF